MKSCTFTLNGYEITSYGNGTSYTVRRNGKSFFLQGDDAIAFSETMESEVEGALSIACEDYMAAIGESE